VSELVWVVYYAGEWGYRYKALVAAFIWSFLTDRAIKHLLFHVGEAGNLGGDGGDCLEGCP
jgi:hypothetical protein